MYNTYLSVIIYNNPLYNTSSALPTKLYILNNTLKGIVYTTPHLLKVSSGFHTEFFVGGGGGGGPGKMLVLH